ncbi:hypothetical protein U1Q18_037771 [Sarracenia purpurea var. burkii]
MVVSSLFEFSCFGEASWWAVTQAISGSGWGFSVKSLWLVYKRVSRKLQNRASSISMEGWRRSSCSRALCEWVCLMVPVQECSWLPLPKGLAGIGLGLEGVPFGGLRDAVIFIYLQWPGHDPDGL